MTKTDAEILEWLSSRPAFQWDAGNLVKLAKHGNDSIDVETMFDAALVFAGRVEHEEARWIVLGVLASGRHVAMVFTRRGDLLRPISVRAMRRKERAFYGEATGN